MSEAATPGRGVLGWIERVGNRLPDPVFIFVWLIGALVLLSLVGAALGWSAVNPVTNEALTAKSLLSPENLNQLFVGMPQTLTSFPPLGFVLVVMYGAAVAERAGLFAAAVRGSLLRAPKALLTPIVVITGMVSHHASDASYVVVIPLAATVFAAAGRHPLAGLTAAFAAVSGGFAGNVFPGASDALVLGITEPAARLIDPDYSVNIAGNWWFILGIVVVFTPICWFVTDRIVEPRLGAWNPEGGAPQPRLERTLAPEERRGLVAAGLAALALIGLWTLLTLMPASPFVDPEAEPGERYNPLFRSLIAFFALLFFLTGTAYGVASRTVSSHRDLVRMMTEGVVTLAPYVVLAFFAAHFVAMFNWSGLGSILAVNGAEALRGLDAPAPLLLVMVLLLSSVFDLFIGSASAKWAALAPVVVPMLMLLGISPEMTTAAYRMGDSVTNIATPLMSYFPLVLSFCQRWDRSWGVGSLLSNMLPYAAAFMVAGLAMTVTWVALELPVGPGSPVRYAAPAAGG
jgi:aminobenzoyl-glutamate transport protein